ncbi:hypothetical protein TKK_0011560 [Trichogramma kaykai]
MSSGISIRQSDTGSGSRQIPRAPPRPPVNVENPHMGQKKAVGLKTALAVLADRPKLALDVGEQDPDLQVNSETNLDIRMSAMGQSG